MLDFGFQGEQLVRRAFLGRASLGLGSVALAGLLQAERVGCVKSSGCSIGSEALSRRGESATFRSEGQASDFSVHGGWAFAA